MDSIGSRPAVLVLEDGTVFHGKAAGAIGTTSGEICFNTGMTGYQEIFTDPSYFGQILVATNAHIGNYGIKEEEVESDSIKISGFICKNFTDRGYSRQLADLSIQDYFERENLVAIQDVDTRAIVKHIRTKGAMNAIISSEELDVEKLKQQLKQTPSMDGLELATRVTTEEAYFLGNPNAKWKVAVLDFGTKRNILNCFIERDCFLKYFRLQPPLRKLKSGNRMVIFFPTDPVIPRLWNMPS